MSLKERTSDLRPFEFRLTREDKEHLRRASSDAGVSTSEYIRRTFSSYAEEVEFREAMEVLSKQISSAQVRG
jgi:hypothetical protein